METAQVIRSLEALMGAEPEVAEGFLLASIYARALRTGEPPREIAEALYKALPESDAWPAFRQALVQVLEDEEGAPTA